MFTTHQAQRTQTMVAQLGTMMKELRTQTMVAQLGTMMKELRTMMKELLRDLHGQCHSIHMSRFRIAISNVTNLASRSSGATSLRKENVRLHMTS